MRLASAPWLAGMLLLTSLGSSLFVLTVLRIAERDARLRALDERAAERHSPVERELRRLEDIVISLEALFRSSEHVTRAEFALYCKPILSRHEEIQALEWVPVVDAAERDAYERELAEVAGADARITEQAPDGSLVTAGRRASHAPVTYLEPTYGGEHALGFDLASEPSRAQVLERARVHGNLAASAGIPLPQDAAGAPGGMLVVKPHLRDGRLHGYAVGVFHVGEVLTGALRALPAEQLEVLLLDAETQPPQLLASAPSRLSPAAVGRVLADAASSGRLREEQLTIGDRRWRLAVIASPEFVNAGRTWVPWLALAIALLATALVAGYVVLTARHAAALGREATHDSLTGLLNRRGLEVALEEARERPALAVLLVNFDDFARVNQAYGYGVGDVVLAELSRRVREAVGAQGAVGRIGGDELLVLAAGADSVEAGALAERIRRQISSQPVLAMPSSVIVTASIGITMVGAGIPSLLQLLTEARSGLRASKTAGKNQSSFGPTSGAMLAGGIGERELVRRACEGGELRVVTEPLVRLADETVTGFELLVRGPAGELEKPADLFRAATEQGMLTLLDMRCLRACVADAAKRRLRGAVHLNLLPSTLLDVPASTILRILQDLPEGSKACIEVNEQQFISHPSYLAEGIGALRRAGVRIAIDDVGSGRGTLDSVLVLKPDVVKIDVSLVRGAFEDVDRSQLLARLVRLCQSLDIEMVAEGVETQGDRDFVRSLGIGSAQGYLWHGSEPRSAA